jgi:hypothetical protein
VAEAVAREAKAPLLVVRGLGTPRKASASSGAAARAPGNQGSAD